MCRNTRVKCYQEKTHISSHTFLQSIKSTTYMLPLNYKYTYYVPLMTPKKCKYICFHARWWRFHTFPSYTSTHRLVVLHFIFRDNFSLLDILRFICEVDKILTCFSWTWPPSAPKPNIRCVVSFWTLFILEYNICLLTKQSMWKCKKMSERFYSSNRECLICWDKRIKTIFKM